jgi:hypothetical protein
MMNLSRLTFNDRLKPPANNASFKHLNDTTHDGMRHLSQAVGKWEKTVPFTGSACSAAVRRNDQVKRPKKNPQVFQH